MWNRDEWLAWVDAISFLKWEPLEEDLHEFVVEWLHALLEARPAEVA